MKTSVKVAHLTTVHPRGDIRIFRKECLGLAGRGYSVHLFVADGKGDARSDGVTIHDIGISRGRLTRVLIRPWVMWRAARQIKAAIYHFHDPELIPVGLMLRLAGAKVIYDVHEDVPRAVLSKFWIPRPLRRLVATVFEWFEDFSAARLSAVAAATPHIARRFARRQPNSVVIANFPLRDELSAAPGSEAISRTVCYVGGIGLIRGAVEMVHAIDRLDARLILAGSFESSSSEKLVRALAGWRKVDYRGLVDRDEVRRIFSQSRAGLLLFHPEPNHVDAQPNKMFEYMSAGLPVVASDFPLWRDLIEETGCGICTNPLDPEAIAAAIETILDDPDRAAQMARRGKEAVATRFQWQFEEPRLAALYESLLAP